MRILLIHKHISATILGVIAVRVSLGVVARVVYDRNILFGVLFRGCVRLYGPDRVEPQKGNG